MKTNRLFLRLLIGLLVLCAILGVAPNTNAKPQPNATVGHLNVALIGNQSALVLDPNQAPYVFASALSQPGPVLSCYHATPTSQTLVLHYDGDINCPGNERPIAGTAYVLTQVDTGYIFAIPVGLSTIFPPDGTLIPIDYDVQALTATLVFPLPSAMGHK